MEKINWTSTTPINTTNLNQLQSNVENAINGVVESGNNNNGSYVKFVDGTMICKKQVAGTTKITSAWGTMYESSVIDCGNYAINFVETPRIYATVVGSGCFIESVGGGANTNSFGNMYLALPFSREEHNYIVDLLAVGRWK